jgi:NitT/TauT family transport system substrate-binding protein
MTKRTLALAIVVLSLAGALLVKDRLDRKRSFMEITLAISAQPLSAPVYVAQGKGIFLKEGLGVTLVPYSAGVDALRAATSGKADFGTVSDVPIMFAGLEGERMLIVATIASSSEHIRIVARRDRGIARPGDLRGKRVGMRAGTSSEYYLYAFLTFNGIDARHVRTVDLPLACMAGALARGEIDAAASWDPHAAAQEKALGSDAVTFTNRYVYKLDWNIVANPGFVRKHPDAAEKLLRALSEATVHMKEDPSEAWTLTERAIGSGDFTLSGVDFDVGLEQSLLINLESEARWAIRNGRTDHSEVPDYLSMIYTKALEKVRPRSVTVIR